MHKDQNARPVLTKRATEIDVALGNTILKNRHCADLTLDTLSKRLGISTQQLQKYEMGASRISGGMLVRIAQELSVPINSLFPTIPDTPREEMTDSSILKRAIARSVADIGDISKLKAILTISTSLSD